MLKLSTEVTRNEMQKQYLSILLQTPAAKSKKIPLIMECLGPRTSLYQASKPTSLQIHQGNPSLFSNRERGFGHKEDPNPPFASPDRLQKPLFVSPAPPRSREILSV